MLLPKEITRVIYSPTDTDLTYACQDPNQVTSAFAMLDDDTQFLYLGFYGKFASRYFHMGVVNSSTNPVLVVEYWNGTDWAPVLDLHDETIGFTQSGFISWRNKDDWKPTNVDPLSDESEKLYWVRISPTGDEIDGTPTLNAVLNLFSNDTALRRFYPELVTDSRYLPSGRTNFIEQHIAAKNRVVTKLKQRRVIEDESQIIDINEVAEAAVHACADIILSPISTDEELLKRIRAAFENEMNDLTKHADANKDGQVSDTERQDISFGTVVRR